MRIADVIETCFPMLPRVERQRVRFTGYGVDFAARLMNRIDDTFTLIAAQLAAAWRSPKATVEDQHHEGVVGDYRVEPTLSYPRRRIKQRGRRAHARQKRLRDGPPQSHL